MGLGVTEGLIVLGIGLLFFGGKKLPQLGKSMGEALTNFKKGIREENEKENEQSKIEE